MRNLTTISTRKIVPDDIFQPNGIELIGGRIYKSPWSFVDYFDYEEDGENYRVIGTKDEPVYAAMCGNGEKLYHVIYRPSLTKCSVRYYEMDGSEPLSGCMERGIRFFADLGLTTLGLDYLLFLYKELGENRLRKELHRLIEEKNAKGGLQ